MGAPSLELLSIPPPIIHTEEDLDSPLPESILLDPSGYLSDRTNGTTADGRRSRKNRKRIRVSFWIATPPRVSCFTVHCPDLKPDAFGDVPRVVCAEDDLVLLRVAFRSQRPDMYGDRIRFFVYQAGTKHKPPSLRLLPTLPAHFFTICHKDTAFLRCRGGRGSGGQDDMFYLAALRWSPVDWDNPHKFYDLHLYSSKTGRWSTRLMHLDDVPRDFRFRSPSKVVTIGGELGSVGWVDLRHGVLICDILLLDNSQSLRYIPVPSPLVANPIRGYPLCARNMIVLEGYIKFFELHNHVRKSSSESDTEERSWIIENWVAASKRMKISSIGSNNNNWEEEFTIECSDEIPVDSAVLARMLPPDLQEGGDRKPSFKRIGTDYPVMSLHDADVVYILHTPDDDGFECKAYVIALDMRNKTVKGVAEFGSAGRRLGYGFRYLASDISKHLGVWSSTTRHKRNAAETN